MDAPHGPGSDPKGYLGTDHTQGIPEQPEITRDCLISQKGRVHKVFVHMGGRRGKGFFFLRARATCAAAPLRGERNTAPRARAGPGKRHPARGTPRAQPRDVRSAGRDTWNLTGEALGRPRKRSWRRCSHARSGRRSAIRGAHSGALDRPEPSDHAARAPILTSAPYSAADASGSSCAAGARLR